MGEPKTSQDFQVQNDFTQFSMTYVWSALISLSLLMMAMSLGGLYFKEEISTLASLVSHQFGWLGLAMLTMIGDSFPSPFPPDIALVVIAKGPLRSDWSLYLGVIVFASFLAGHLAYFWGHLLKKQKWVPKRIKEWPQRHEGLVKKWGGRVVMIGALTPLPFSLSCMSAGFVELEYRVFFLATLWRIPRIFCFYFVFHFL